MVDVADKQLLDALARCVQKSRGTTFEKILKSPVRLPWSKLIEKYCHATRGTMTLQARTFWGDDMNVVFPELISCFLYRYGFFEENLSTIVMMHVKPGQTFFDVGTHFGYFSMLASRLVGPGGQVHSFEPTAATYKVVQSNLKSKSNARLNNLAAWSGETTMTFKDYGVQYSAFNSIYGAKLTESVIGNITPREYEVKTISIDKYIADTGAKPDFMKIDAESAEYDILKGMERTLAEIRPAITLEVGDIDEGAFIDSSDSVRFLLEHNYKAFEFRDGALREHLPAEKYRYDNILFLPG